MVPFLRIITAGSTAVYGVMEMAHVDVGMVYVLKWNSIWNVYVSIRSKNRSKVQVATTRAVWQLLKNYDNRVDYSKAEVVKWDIMFCRCTLYNKSTITDISSKIYGRELDCEEGRGKDIKIRTETYNSRTRMKTNIHRKNHSCDF